VGAELIRETEKSLDSLFSALDGKLADGAPARILGIYDDGKEWWIQVARGQVTLNGVTLAQGDGAAVSQETGLAIEAISDAEELVFDLA